MTLAEAQRGRNFEVMRKSKVYELTDEDFISLIKTADSYSDCLRAIGLSTNGGSSTDSVKRRIKELCCDTSHFKRRARYKTPSYKLIDVLVENSLYKNIQCLKQRLIKEDLLKYECSCCGITDWRGEPISLQLHHKNGVNTDHRLNNLCLLCPNCHSQTTTFAGKNLKK